jgi:hypothetical protein
LCDVDAEVFASRLTELGPYAPKTAPIQALPAQNADLDLQHVQPTSTSSQ